MLSILFMNEDDKVRAKNTQMPEFFKDLNLDQIVDAITSKKKEYDLKSYFYVKLEDIDSIKYRQEVMQDLENEELFENLRKFEDEMHTMKECFDQSDKSSYKYQKERWFLDGVKIYCDAVVELEKALSIELNSRGFTSFHNFLKDYVNSDDFKSLAFQSMKLKDELSQIRYTLFVKGNTIKVRKYESQKNYSQEIEEIFEKFRQGSVKNYSVKFNEFPDMNHVEAKILDFVAMLYPDVFDELDRYYVSNVNFMNEVISEFVKEILFYISYLEYISQFKRIGLEFCIPQMTQKKEIYASRTFDLALASLIIINEMFSSTTIEDALFLSKKVMDVIYDLDILTVWVTFIDEIASMNEKVVSMVSNVDPANPSVRTYKILRKPAEGLSYALSIAEKYNLTYKSLKERIKS